MTIAEREFAVAKKAIGERGSWFATVGGERLPCVHDQWCLSEQRGMRYHDPLIRMGERQADDFVSAIQAGRKVILTRSTSEHGLSRTAVREGYIGIFEVDGVEVGEDGLRFRFTKRLQNLT